jgi:catechol 2,3-dioxygenase-like lactoylglutathione lyase family enzyme
MTIRFHSPCVFVSDLDRARAFYEETLGQTPSLILDGYVVYPGFCLWRTDTARRHVFDETDAVPAGPMGRDNFELYFETEQLDDAWDRVLAHAAMLHPMKIQPWGQRCFRVRDPEGHIVELAEPMETVIRRMRDVGKTEPEIVAATMMPPDFVRHALEA